MPLVSTELVSAGGVRLARYDWGGDGDPVVLAHATGFHGLIWRPIAERLVEAGRHVWSFDFRGHGDSEPSPDGYAWERFADDVLGVLDGLGLAGDPALLSVGHSKGAAALLLAELAAPGTIRRAWCYEPVVMAGEPRGPQVDFPLARSARRRRAQWSSPDEARRSWASRAPLDALDPACLGAYVDGGLRRRADGTWELKCDPTDEAAVYEYASAHRLWPERGALQTRVRIVCGERSDAVTPELGARLAAGIPNATLEVMAGLGHFGPLEDPDAATASILAFDDKTR
jgi:pimeloyl-ACP methyl ester carboxylesterase